VAVNRSNTELAAAARAEMTEKVRPLDTISFQTGYNAAGPSSSIVGKGIHIKPMAERCGSLPYRAVSAMDAREAASFG
jgi:hypothetical protein